MWIWIGFVVAVVAGVVWVCRKLTATGKAALSGDVAKQVAEDEADRASSGDRSTKVGR